MAHYAYLDDNNTVTQVIVGKNEGEDGVDWEQYYGAVRCSYNTREGAHINGGQPFRMNFPGIGWTYDPNWGPHGAFIPPKPFPSWVINEQTACWEAPIPLPTLNGSYQWDESNQQWIDVTEEPELLPPVSD